MFRPHRLRRTYASLRTACGDDPVFVSRQIGHTDVRFTLNVYAQSVKRRDRMSAAEQGEYDRAVEWASWASAPLRIGTTETLPLLPGSDELTDSRRTAIWQGFPSMDPAGIEPATSCMPCKRSPS